MCIRYLQLPLLLLVSNKGPLISLVLSPYVFHRANYWASNSPRLLHAPLLLNYSSLDTGKRKHYDQFINSVSSRVLLLPNFSNTGLFQSIWIIPKQHNSVKCCRYIDIVRSRLSMIATSKPRHQGTIQGEPAIIASKNIIFVKLLLSSSLQARYHYNLTSTSITVTMQIRRGTLETQRYVVRGFRVDMPQTYRSNLPFS